MGFKEQLREELPPAVFEVLEARDDILTALEECKKDPCGCDIERLTKMLEMLDEFLSLKLDVDNYRDIRQRIFGK